WPGAWRLVEHSAFWLGGHPMRDFASVFSCLPTAAADAPGRVNLIGEHTDYNGGFVLPTAIPHRPPGELSPRIHRPGRALSSTQCPTGEWLEYRLGTEERRGQWIDYVQGITWLLMREGHTGIHQGFNAWIASTVPVGSGLSSSAALSVSLLRALRQAFALRL